MQFSIRLINFLLETMEAKRQRDDILKVPKEDCQPKILYAQNYPPELEKLRHAR